MPVQVDTTRVSAVAEKNILVGSGLCGGVSGGGDAGFLVSGFLGAGGADLARRQIKRAFFVLFRKMDKYSRRNIRNSAAGLVKAKHLQATRNGEEEDRRCEEDTAVAVY